jgi:hypothetical protein
MRGKIAELSNPTVPWVIAGQWGARHRRIVFAVKSQLSPDIGRGNCHAFHDCISCVSIAIVVLLKRLAYPSSEARVLVLDTAASALSHVILFIIWTLLESTESRETYCPNFEYVSRYSPTRVSAPRYKISMSRYKYLFSSCRLAYGIFRFVMLLKGR